MTSEELRDHADSINDEPSEFFLRCSADEIDRLNVRITQLESFARELWEHARHSMQVTSDDPLGSEYNEWARGMIAKARELGIEERNDGPEKSG